MPTALVTGAKGHTGSFLVRRLLDDGYAVIATDLPPKERAVVMKKETVFRDDLAYLDVEAWAGVTFIPGDLTDKDSLRPLFEGDEVDVIFHPASLYDYFAQIGILRKINVGGLRNLLEVIHEAYDTFPRFLHWSTCGVYGEPEYERDPETKAPLPADETAPYDPPNPYSISKKEQELLLKELAAPDAFDIPYTIIRPGPIYGPYQMYGMFHIFYMINKMGHFMRASVYPKHKRLMMPMIHVENLVNAAAFLATKDEAIGEAYNVAEDPVTQEDWMEYCYHLLGVTYSNIPIPWFLYKIFAKLIYNWERRENKKARKWGIRPKIDLSMADYLTHQYYFSNAKLKALGFEFKYGPLDGTRQTVEWYKEHGWLEREENHIARRVRDAYKHSGRRS